MAIDQTLQFHTAALALVGAVFVAAGGQNSGLAGALASAAVSSIFVTDIWGWLRLNRFAGNGLAIVAVLWSLRHFFEVDPDQQLLAIAHMLCALQIVLLFQEKSARVYWQLIVLSVLQVVVAAALDPGPGFSLWLGGYAALALSALVWLCIYRETHSAAPPARRPSSGTRQWSILLATPLVGPARATSEGVERSFSRGLVARQTALLAIVTGLFSFVFFFATPRFSELSWSGFRNAGNTTGFRPEILLKERGQIHLSSQKVMRVSLTKRVEGKSVSLIGSFSGEPYFWGAAMTDYVRDENGSRWVAWPRPGSGGGRRVWGYAAVTPMSRGTVRQDIALEPGAVGRGFAIMPAAALRSSDGAWMPASGSRSTDDGAAPLRQQRYAMETQAIAGTRQFRQVRGIPSLLRWPGSDTDQERLLAVDRERFPKLLALAAEALAQRGLAAGNPYEQALALEEHFLAPGSYQYSLNLNFARDPDVDPIEDFVVNQRAGHCEYFASALVLMLRSQGIPARLVTGFRGGELNMLGQYYVVQERHAHAWVEAWLPPNLVPPEEIAGPPGDTGVWYRLDPTPGRDGYIAADEQALGNRVAQAFDYVELLWRDYVLSLNKNRQEDAVYEPLTAHAASLPSWVESRALRNRIRQWMQRVGLDLSWPPKRSGPQAFEGGLAVLVVAGLGLLVVVVQGCRWAVPLVVSWIDRRGRTAVTTSPAVAFYLRLEWLLGRLPLRRRRGQTPHELAVAAADQLAASPPTQAVAEVPETIVAAYYRVRFGGARLDNVEHESIEQALALLGHAVEERRQAR